MQKWKIWAAFIAVFIAGAIAGVVGSGMVIKHHFRGFEKSAEFRSKMGSRIVRHMTDELDLSPEQTETIRKEVFITMDALQRLHKETQPRIRATLKKGKERIKQHLTPEQQAEFDEFIKHRKHRRFGMFHLPPPPPPPMQ